MTKEIAKLDERAQRLAKALMATLDAIELHEERRDRPSFASADVDGLMTLDQLDRLTRQGEFLLADPIGYGLRKTVRKIGEVLGRDYPNDMEEIAEYAAAPSSRNYGVRANIVDKHWDGVQRSTGGLWVA